MALTLDELRARTGWIGSSDVPAILGVCPYRNIADVYAEKVGLVEPIVTTNDAADWGDRMEPVLCDWLADRLGHPVVRGERRQSADGILRAQLDGWMPDVGEPVEIKTSGLLNPMFRADTAGWGPDGTDEVPFRVIAQVQLALILTGSPRAHVGAFLGGGAGPRHYVVDAHAGLQAEIERRARVFWTQHVIPRVPPTDIPHLDTLHAMIRAPRKVTEVDVAVIDRYRAVKEQEALIEAALKDARKDLLHALGDAEEGHSPLGTVTYYANKNGARSLRVKEA